jgi:hypothetical protein
VSACNGHLFVIIMSPNKRREKSLCLCCRTTSACVFWPKSFPWKTSMVRDCIIFSILRTEPFNRHSHLSFSCHILSGQQSRETHEENKCHNIYLPIVRLFWKALIVWGLKKIKKIEREMFGVLSLKQSFDLEQGVDTKFFE